MLIKGMDVAEYCTVLKYGTSKLKKEVKSKYRTIVSGPGVTPAPKMVAPGNNERKVGQEPPPMHLSWITWIHHWKPQWIRLMGTKMDPLWIDLSNLDP